MTKWHRMRYYRSSRSLGRIRKESAAVRLRCSVCLQEFEADSTSGSGGGTCPRCRPGEVRPDAADSKAATAGAGAAGVASCAPPREFGRYEILQEISRGAMGIVYLAREKTLGRLVALKVLLAGEHASEEQVGRFIREARAVARLRHPNIVPIHDVGVVDGRHYYTMDYIEGEPLSKLIAERKLDIRRALDIIECVADAIHCAHAAGIIHRDIKPSNIMIDRDGRPLITDFGLAKPIDSVEYTRDGTTIGTPAYMPPEQARGNIDEITPQSDVYSIGAVLYEMVTGRAPFEGPNVLDIILDVLHDDVVPPRKWNPRIHADIQTIILRAMEKDPARRYRSAAEFRDDIRRFKAGEAIRARPPGVWRQVFRFLNRHRAAVASLAAVLAVLAGAAYFVREIKLRMEEQARAALVGALGKQPMLEQPAWSKVWEDASPRAGQAGRWEERASFLEGREIFPKVADPFHGNVRLTTTVTLAPSGEEPVIACGLVSTQDRDAPVPFYGVVSKGKIKLYAVPDIEESGAAHRTVRDLTVMAEKACPQLVPGSSYSVLLERRDMDIRFQVAGDSFDAEVTVRNLHFTNWRAKNLLPSLLLKENLQWQSFRLDRLITGSMDTFETADSLFSLGEYNGARTMYLAIVDSGRPAERLGLARLRLGMHAEIKRIYEEALVWYRSVAGAGSEGAIQAEAALREVMCLAKLLRREEAAAAFMELSKQISVRSDPAWEISSSPWVWELAQLAEFFLKGSDPLSAAEVVVVAKPPVGWSRMESAAIAAGLGLAEAGRAGDLLALAAACPGADLAPAFTKAITRLSESDREGALSVLAFCARRWPERSELFAEPAADLARKFVAGGDAEGPVRIHRVWPLDSVYAVFPDAVGAAMARKGYDLAKRILAYAHSQKPEHDDALRGLSIGLAKQLCADGAYADVRSVFEAYPDPALGVSFEEAILALGRTGRLEQAIELLEFSRKNLGPADERLAASSAQLSQRLAETGDLNDALRVISVVNAYPGPQHVPYVRKAMAVLASNGRPVDAMLVFASLRANLPDGDAGLAEDALSIIEGIGDPIARERAFAALSGVETQLPAGTARIRWLIELGDIACRVGGRPNRAETLYREAAGDVRSRQLATVAIGRLAVLLDTAGRHSEAQLLWAELVRRADAVPALAEAAKAILGFMPMENLVKWQAEHPAEMPGAELAVYVGIRELREGRRQSAFEAFRRARELLRDRRWPFHVLRRLGL